MSKLYPLISPRRQTYTDTHDGHRIYYEEAGAEDGIPVVFLHGGPGSGCKPSHRQFFNPKKYRSILVDQRGAGKSLPFGEITANTTELLVADLERIRNELGIEKWLLFGGSWGAALALYYAINFPGRALGIVLRGTFLARRYDVDWFFEYGASRLLPREWAQFKREVALLQRDGESILECLHRCTFEEDQATSDKVAALWAQWSEAVVMYSFNNVPSPGEPEATESIRAKTRIEMHYAKHAYFMPENFLLDNIHEVPDVPIRIIHGLRDITCTPDAGWAVHEKLNNSEFIMLRNAGHLSGESAMTEALVEAADAMAQRLARI
ncbi:MAG: prolyl aminopeptidase [Gammaproteobacteria bacterium]